MVLNTNFPKVQDFLSNQGISELRKPIQKAVQTVLGVVGMDLRS